MLKDLGIISNSYGKWQKNEGTVLKYLLIINPRAGQYTKIENDLLALFTSKNIGLDIHETTGPRDATRVAKRARGKYDVVIAAGGDGTINEVINGLAEDGTALGIIPNGTENVLAQELGIPLNHMKAGKMIIRGRVKEFDLGKAKNRYFIMMSGVGLDAKASREVEMRPMLKKMLGRSVYPVAALRAYFSYNPKKLEIWLDDQVLPRWGYYAIIGNIKIYGGALSITPMAKPDDGYLDICIFKNKDLFSMMKYLVAAKFKNKLAEAPSIEYFRVKKVKIKSKQKTYVHTDAEVIGTTPVSFEVVPKSIKIIC